MDETIFEGNEVTKQKQTSTKIERDARTGQFITVKVARKRKRTAIVETIKKKK